MMSSGFTPRRKPTISLDPKRMGSFDRIGAVPSSRNTSARLRDYLPPQLWNLLNDTTGKGSRAALVLLAPLATFLSRLAPPALPMALVAVYPLAVVMLSPRLAVAVVLLP